MKTAKATKGQPEFDAEIRVPRFIWRVTTYKSLAPGEERRGGPQNFMGRTAKIVGGFRPPIPGPTSTGPDCSCGTSNFAGSTSSSTSTGPDCSSGTSNFAGSTSSSGPTDRSIDNYACDFPSGRTGAHPNLTSAIHQSFPDCETDACNFPHPCLTWSGGFTSGTP